MPGKVAMPAVPQSLKQISSYIQRADELKAKDPVMAYWCTYYAAQMGLDLKVHEVAARDYLYTLIAVLEDMKKELKGNDAIESEAAGAAYVENFALRVFGMADNEDRRGDASRSTAKKFLAAANFLELLKVFEKNDNARVNDEKVKYAKWKASDIAKAFREGRKPTPGGAGPVPGDEDIQALSPSLDTPFTRTLGELSPNGSPAPLPTEFAGRTPAARSRQLPGDITPPGSNARIPGESEFPRPSTIAARANGLDDHNYGPNYADVMAKKTVHFSPSVVGGLSSTDGSPPPSPEVVDHVASPANGYFQPFSQPQFRPGPGPSSLGRVDPVSAPLPDSSPSGSSRTSVEGSPHSRARPLGRPRSGSSPPLPQGGSPPSVNGSRRTSPSSHSKRLSLQQPPAAPPMASSMGHRRASSASRNSPPQGGNAYLQAAPPGSRSPTSPGFVNLSPRSSNIQGLPPTAPATVPGSYATTGPYKPNPSPPSKFATPGPPPIAPPMELTPSMIAKAQKHARFAISALEYEDAEQARKELRAALAVLGDR